MGKRRGPARRRDEQRRDRQRRGENVYLFAPDDRCLCKVERDDWDFAVSLAGGDIVEAAKIAGFEVPRGTRALWGPSEQAAIGAYRAWQKRKAAGNAQK